MFGSLPAGYLAANLQPTKTTDGSVRTLLLLRLRSFFYAEIHKSYFTADFPDFLEGKAIKELHFATTDISEKLNTDKGAPGPSGVRVRALRRATSQIAKTLQFWPTSV